MRYHSQNLNESKKASVPDGSMFWHGRAWLYGKKQRELGHIEWLLGNKARDWALTVTFGTGDSDADACLHFCIPFIASIYFTVADVYRCKESKVGISGHDGGIRSYTFTDQNDWERGYPWWKKSHGWDYPWTLKHHLTEILKPVFGLCSSDWPVVWSDIERKPFLETFSDKEAVTQSVTEVYDYTYVRKNGDVQKVKAQVFVDRMTWRARWWPLIPIKKVRTCISVGFVDDNYNPKDIGEGVDGWKGGTTGCGYEMEYGETPLECLRRMEKERKFER